MRVLFAEDDTALAEVVSEALVEEGHVVVHVTNPTEAHRLAISESWDAVVVDAFGQHDEPGAAERASLTALQQHAPVVLATARAWAMGAQPEDLGIAAILRKPYDLDTLLSTIERVGHDRTRGHSAAGSN